MSKFRENFDAHWPKPDQVTSRARNPNPEEDAAQCDGKYGGIFRACFLEPVKKVSEKACTNANGLLQGLGCSTESDTTAT